MLLIYYSSIFNKLKIKSNETNLDQMAILKNILIGDIFKRGAGIEYIKAAYETNWMSTVGKNIDEIEHLIAEHIGVL